MRVLVTGGAGFIGSNLVHALLEGGNEVLVVDDLSRGGMHNVHPAAAFRRIDILDEALREATLEFRPESVVHFAAQTDVNASIEDPAHDRLVNVEGTRLVARAAAEAGASRVISASSAAVYGEPAVVPLAETSPKTPENPYGHSKLAAEGVLAEELGVTDTDFASLRFSNVFGPRQDWTGEGGAVAIFSARAVRGETPVVYGTGEQTRDFVFVADVVSAVFACLTAEGPLAGDGDDGPAYNISTGTETSVNALATAITDAAGLAGDPEHAPAREGDVDRSALDPGKAYGAFGWHARVPFERAVAVTVDWFAREARK
jgi:UDP-glucose 4-epimerase